MVKLLFLCLVLAGCYTARSPYEYTWFHIDDSVRANIDDDFIQYLKHFPQLDPSRDGYYLVYGLGVDAIEPGAFLFFYDENDSITMCPFGTSYCKKYEFKRDDFPIEDLESIRPVLPKQGSMQEHIFGYQKKAGKKMYYHFSSMDYCHGNIACKDEWRQSIQENIELYDINSRLFNRFAYFVMIFYEAEALANGLQTGKFSNEDYERFKRDYQKRLSHLDREYRELNAELKKMSE